MVIAIIAVLMALLVPAVQKVREAGNRAICASNMRQVAIAMHNYHEEQKRLPPGVGFYGCCWGTWQMKIMPYIEQDAYWKVFRNYDGHDRTMAGGTWRYSSNTNPANVTRKRFRVLTCPTDQPNAPLNQMTAHNYAVNYGNTSFFQSDLNGVRFQGAPFTCYPPHWFDKISPLCSDHDQFGRFGGGAGKPEFALTDIRDGTSTTFMLGEVIQGQRLDLRGFTWWGGASGFTTYSPPNSSEPDVLTGGACDVAATRAPCTILCTATRPRMQVARSWHPGGVNVVFCDGHATFIRDTVTIQVWRALSTLKGLEVISEDS